MPETFVNGSPVRLVAGAARVVEAEDRADGERNEWLMERRVTALA